MTKPIEGVMTPHWKKQTQFYEKGVSQGNCMQACVASLFDLPLESVPNFASELSWSKSIEGFVKSRGYGIYHRYKPSDAELHIPNGHQLICGMSSRGCQHMVIYKDGRRFFDPHPSDEFTQTIDELWVLHPLDPAASTALLSDIRAARECLQDSAAIMKQIEMGLKPQDLTIMKHGELRRTRITHEEVFARLEKYGDGK